MQSILFLIILVIEFFMMEFSTAMGTKEIRTPDWAAATLVSLAAFLCRSLFLWMPPLTIDEYWSLENHVFFWNFQAPPYSIYWIHQDYMVPLSELMALFIPVGNPIASIRLVDSFFAAIGVGFFFLSLRFVCDRLMSVLVTSVAIVPSSPALYYTGMLSNFGIAFFLCSLMTFGAAVYYFKNSRWALFVVLISSSLSAWHFQISLGYILAFTPTIVVLYYFRSKRRGLFEAFSEIPHRARIVLFSTSTLFGFCFFTGLYFSLAHPQGIVQMRALVPLICSAALSLTILWQLWRANRYLFRSMVLMCLVMSMVGLPFLASKVYHRTFVAPYLVEANAFMRVGGGAYAWKNYTSWPSQFAILAEEIIPSLLSGRLEESLRPNGSESFGASSFLMFLGIVILCFLWSTIIVQSRHSSSKRFAIWQILPLLIMLSLLFPSWRLFGPASFRYLVPYLPGLVLLLSFPVYLRASGPLRYSVPIILLGLAVASLISDNSRVKLYRGLHQSDFLALSGESDLGLIAFNTGEFGDWVIVNGISSSENVLYMGKHPSRLFIDVRFQNPAASRFVVKNARLAELSEIVNFNILQEFESCSIVELVGNPIE